MSRRQRLSFAVLAVLVGRAGAETPALRCCDRKPGWTVGVESGVVWAKTEEIVEARPEYAAEHLSRLIWKAPAGVAGIRLSYRTRGPCV